MRGLLVFLCLFLLSWAPAQRYELSGKWQNGGIFLDISQQGRSVKIKSSLSGDILKGHLTYISNSKFKLETGWKNDFKTDEGLFCSTYNKMYLIGDVVIINNKLEDRFISTGVIEKTIKCKTLFGQEIPDSIKRVDISGKYVKIGK